MKKIYFSLVALLSLIIFIPYSYAKNDVKVYMFTKNGCKACEEAFKYFEGKLEENPDAFELVNVEVWCGTDYTNPNNATWILGNEDALSLMQDMLELHDEDTERLATPTIVVGDYLQVGADNLDDLYDRIIKEQSNKKYKDEVALKAEEEKYDLSAMVKEHGAASCDIMPTTETNKLETSDIIIIVSVCVVLIGGFVGLILISKKN